MRKLVYGVGINNSNYTVSWVIDGKRVTCPFYTAWRCMLMRCYCEKTLDRNPRYKECSVVQEWLSFMNFRGWMVNQDYNGKQLDKDLLQKGNKVYGPDTCVFLSSKINSFLTDSQSRKGESLQGVYKGKKDTKYKATCYDVDGSAIYLGMFDSEEEGHHRYISEKLRIATELSKVQVDPRVSEALVKRFSSHY